MKTFEITIGHAIQAFKFFNDSKYTEKEMSMKASLWFVKNAKVLGEVVTVFNDKRKAIFDKYATEISKPGEPVKTSVPVEYMTAFEQEVKSLLSEKVEINFVEIPVSELNTLSLSPKEAIIVMFAIAED